MVAQYPANMLAPREALTVAITGVSGYIGSRLLEQLDEDDRVARVLGFDLRPPAARSSKLLFDPIDIRSEALRSRLDGVDVVVHLAFVMDPIKDEAEMRDVNVLGSQNVFDAAAGAGVGKVVYLSSAVAYGAHPDNEVPLTEASPLRANLDFSYAAHKLEVEYAVKEFRREHPEVVFTTFRPAIVFGRHVDNAWSHLLEAPLLFAVRGHSPPLQFVHEEDVADALRFAVFEDLDGPYNLAAPDWLASDRILELSGKRRVDLAEPKAFSLLERMWDLGLAEAPAGMLHYVMYPWVVSGDKLAQAGFTPKHSSEEALREVLVATAGTIRLGRSRVPRRKLVRGAAAGAGLAGAALAARGLRRRAAHR
jgi:nucleoside-diphosphate-sugar epimerase